MDDLVHSKDKLLQFTEKVTGEDGQVIGYLCANIEEQNLRYDYLEDPSNQEKIYTFTVKEAFPAAEFLPV